MRAAVDVMGGDKAPAAILQGCWDAAPSLESGDQILLVGDQALTRNALDASGLNAEQKKFYRIVASTQIIEMGDSPVEAIRSKPDSSINVMCNLAKKGEADVVISAGNTGACVAAAQLKMRNLPGVSRPAISVTMPTVHGPVAVCDVGANIAPQPHHLHQYGIMASAYIGALAGIANPRVGLMSVGEEDAKGTAVVKEARKLMRDDSQLNFIGNVEGRDLFKGVVVCDGFVGNIVLKFTEGFAEGFFQTIAAELQNESPNLLEQFKPVMKRIFARHDWREQGGAPLLGVRGYFLICHGRSDAKAIKNAIQVGKKLHQSGINDKIVESLKRCQGAPHSAGV